MLWRVTFYTDSSMCSNSDIISLGLGEVEEIAKAELYLVTEDGAELVLCHTLVVPVIERVRGIVDHQLAVSDGIPHLIDCLHQLISEIQLILGLG